MHITYMQKDVEVKTLGEYHDLYLKTDTLLSADVFENFKKMCLNIYEFIILFVNFALFFSASRLAWQPVLKETEVKLELLTYIDMLLMVEKGIKGGICNSINRFSKANNKYMKEYDKNKDSSYPKYW